MDQFHSLLVSNKSGLMFTEKIKRIIGERVCTENNQLLQLLDLKRRLCTEVLKLK